ncbi:MAG: zf-HC2 domain-containing protein [Acidimicrobiia bacterium]|nr:zf-HC2 domain-containing protein [Acidimicrobiia bacterium]
MSGCENAVEYVYQYIDGELTMTRRARVRWHLRRCGNCIDAYSFETELKARVAKAGREAPSEEFLSTLRALIEEEKARPGA